MKKLLRLLGLGCVVVMFFWAAEQDFFQHFSDSQWVARYVANNGYYAVAELMLMGVLLSCVGFPRQVLAFVFGYAFGGLQGALLATLAALMSCILLFYFSRLILRQYIKRRFTQKLIRLEALIIDKTWLKALMIRLLPLGSNYLTNILAGTTCVSPWQFFVGSGIGFLPQMFMLSFAGAGVSLSDEHHLQVSFMLFIIALLIAIYLYRTRLVKQVDQAVKANQ